MIASKQKPHGAAQTSRTNSGSRLPAAESREESFGAYLTRARELRGIPIDQIAEATRIHTTYLRALEEDDLERLPERVFVLGYIRGYAKAIGIDPNEALLRYDEYVQKWAPEPSAPPTLQRPHRRAAPDPRFAILFAALLVVALAVAVTVCVKLAIGPDDDASALGAAPNASEAQVLPELRQAQSRSNAAPAPVANAVGTADPATPAPAPNEAAAELPKPQAPSKSTP
ncbi:MAG: helix-turn-helix domain-containing protein [Myxococcales bacterium]|nr:helix-turn-helix domain-containing protein [Myxococcales bacterium]